MDGQQAAGHEAVAEILGRLAAHAGVECFVSQCEFAGGQGLQHDGDSAAQPPHDIVQIRAGAGAQVVDQRLQCKVGEDRGRERSRAVPRLGSDNSGDVVRGSCRCRSGCTRAPTTTGPECSPVLVAA